ncbi:MAG: aldehyde dehydrogenase family protein, partial [Candidatus Saccharicenans sp.]
MKEHGNFPKETVQPILLAGRFCRANYAETFQAYNPATGEKLPELYPVSEWSDLKKALEESRKAVPDLAESPAEKIAGFLRLYADLLEKNQETIISQAHLETALPLESRLKNTEFPRMINQMRQAAEAVEERSWMQAIIDTK